MMNVLVTGGTGFLGKRLAFRLKALGNSVTILGRNRQIGTGLEAERLRFLPIDLTDFPAMNEAFRGQDFVFHCAALSSPWGKYQDFYQANVSGTRNVIEACKNQGVKRLIHVSTPAVYFNFSHRLNLSENAPLATPSTIPYIQTKLLAETEVNQAFQDGLPTIIIRPRGIFGPGDTAILPRLIRASQRTGIPLIDGGKAMVDVTYVDNVVDALLGCQNADAACLGQTYNITNDQPIKVVDLLELLFKKLKYPLKVKPFSYHTADWLARVMELAANTIFLGKEPILTRYTVGLLAFSQTLNITAAKDRLGYQPHVTLEEGLTRFANWWQEEQKNAQN